MAVMEWSSLGWRDGILLLVVAAAVYLAVMLLKLTQIGRRRHLQVEPPPLEQPRADVVSPLRRRAAGQEGAAEPAATVPAPNAAAAVRAYTEEVAEEVAEPPAEAFTVLPAPNFAWDEVDELLGDPVPPGANPLPPAAQAAVARPGGFGEHLAEHLARSEMEMEVQRMRDEMERMRVELEEMRVARRVSPQYAEAMELAQRGLAAQDVADRLGISLAEAELVHALSRGETNFDEGDGHGEDGYAAGDGFGGRRTG
jgi:hypothetical protein